MNPKKLVFVKMGGAAITDKSQPRTALQENIEKLCEQIARAHTEFPDLGILIGHGSGSFGHYSGQKHKTRDGVKTHDEWLGFAEVWDDARQLNEMVIHTCLAANLPVIAFPPSAWIIAENRNPNTKLPDPIRLALKNGLIPVVNGDVIFDTVLGGTILSTEEVFSLLADEFNPDQIILSSREPGVWQDFPTCTRLVETLSPHEFQSAMASVQGSSGMDVTGGMAKKVALMMDILHKHPKINITITSGIDGHSVYDALVDKPTGTHLHSD